MQKNSIKINAIDAWNKAQKSLGDTEDLTPNKIKTILMKRTIDSYWNFWCKCEVYISIEAVSNLEYDALEFYC